MNALIAALLIAHLPLIKTPSSDQLSPTLDKRLTYGVLWFEMRQLLCIVFGVSVQNLLEGIETMIYRRNRKEWPTICFALCLLFMASESMQVDFFVNNSTATAKMLCEAMETNAVYVLAELFKASTAGFDPLSMDWDSEEAIKLVDNEIGVSRCLRELQSLCQEYCK
jgi:hypothetical protein